MQRHAIIGAFRSPATHGPDCVRREIAVGSYTATRPIPKVGDARVLETEYY